MFLVGQEGAYTTKAPNVGFDRKAVIRVRIDTLEHEMMIWFRGNEMAQRLDTIPGIGIITASALAASITDPHRFGSARLTAPNGCART